MLAFERMLPRRRAESQGGPVRMPRLTIQAGEDAGKIHYINGGRATMGRSVNNDLQIVDRRMSRTHAEVFEQGGAYYVRDLGSKNGTLLNGNSVTLPVLVNEGDIIQVGDSEVVFESDTSHAGSDTTSSGTGTGRSRREGSGTGYRLVDERQWGMTQGQIRAGMPEVTTFGIAADPSRAVQDLSRRLELVYKVTEAVRSTFHIEQLLGQIMEIIIEVLKPDRAYLLLKDPESGELVPEVLKVRGNGSEETEVKISTSICERCMNEGVSLLVSDAAQDDRFSSQESIIANRIRTAMVAPLVYKDDTIGVVYIDTNTRVVPFSQEELELLTGITNQAAVAISNARLHSQLVEQHKLAREMEIARTIQMNLLPKVYPDLPGFEISAMSLPAKHVGGDYYDFLKLPDERVALAIADVSGKGVPAAILTATTRSYLQSETQHPNSGIIEAVTRINQMVHRDVTNDMYVTMALMYADGATGELEYVNAGHSHPVLITREGNVCYLDKGGLFLGILPEGEYESGRITMTPGDILLLFTDGVTDILNSRGEAYGTERLMDLLTSNMEASAEEVRNLIYKECIQHRGDADQFDDFTLIVVKRQEVGSDSSFDEELDLD